jgi:hypothetical protein
MPGDVVSLEGGGFVGPVAVTVGYKFVYNLSVISPNLLVFSAPEQAEGIYDITVSSTDGRRAVLKKVLEYGAEDAIELTGDSSLSLDLGETGETVITNLSSRDLFIAEISRPAGWQVSYPEGRSLIPGGSLLVQVSPTERAKEGTLVIQGGSTRVTIGLVRYTPSAVIPSFKESTADTPPAAAPLNKKETD